MCGICGFRQRDGQPVDRAALRRATAALRHRGPNDEGYLLVQTATGRVVHCGGPDTDPALGLPDLDAVADEPFDLALGFRRLAILDLSPAGHQPMASSDSSCWLIFNGEIYNYKALRTELAGQGAAFRTGSDSEVLLAAYQTWGPDCVRRFNGMWAFAIWDGARRQLFVSRDRFGIKPFYYAQAAGGAFAFASEIKALLVAGAVGFQPDPAAVARYLAQGRMPGVAQGATFFTGVQALPAAHSLVLTRQGLTQDRYWTIPAPTTPLPQAEAAAQYRDLFTDAVRLHLQADVAVGTCLSGGLDSSSIVAVAGQLLHTEAGVALERLGDHQQTFSAVYPASGPWNERAYIEQVTARTGAAGNEIVPTAERLLADLDALVWHQDEPFQSTSIFAQWCVMDLAHRHGATVLLDGQGADEVLGGYRPFTIALGELLRAGQWAEAGRMARAIGAVTDLNPWRLLARAAAQQGPVGLELRARRARLRQAAQAAALCPDLASQLDSEGPPLEGVRAGRSLHDHLAWLVVEDSLPTLLRYEDRNSMAFSIEARVPFLDYRLVEFAFGQGAPWRLHAGWTKWLQRQAVADLLPGTVVWRRDKVGFETPELVWLCAIQPHLTALFTPDSGAGAYLDLAAVRRALPRLLAAGRTAQVWRWTNLALWLRAFGCRYG
ncbi:MAG: asparagine synthase (glutamine-hydrolyzing) [Chloroflexia bacterium]